MALPWSCPHAPSYCFVSISYSADCKPSSWLFSYWTLCVNQLILCAWIIIFEWFQFVCLSRTWLLQSYCHNTRHNTLAEITRCVFCMCEISYLSALTWFLFVMILYLEDFHMCICHELNCHDVLIMCYPTFVAIICFVFCACDISCIWVLFICVF